MTSWLHTLFGLGKVPSRLRAELEREGIALLEEGLPMVRHYRKYRGPNCYFGAARRGGAGYIAITGRRIVMKGYSAFFHEIPVDRLDGENLEFGVKTENRVWLRFEAEGFQDDRRGRVTCTFRTHRAREIEQRVRDIVAASG